MEDDHTLESASAILVGLGAVITTLWNYYFVVVLGMVAAIGVLQAGSKSPDTRTKWFISGALLMFATINGLSIYANLLSARKMVSFIQKQSQGNTDFVDAIGELQPTMLWAFLHPLGPLAVIYWLWAMG
jgi:hypothetical protein